MISGFLKSFSNEKLAQYLGWNRYKESQKSLQKLS